MDKEGLEENHDFIIALALVSVLIFGIAIVLIFGFRPNEQRPSSRQKIYSSKDEVMQDEVQYEGTLPVFDISLWPDISRISDSLLGILTTTSVSKESTSRIQVVSLPFVSTISDWKKLQTSIQPAMIVLIVPEKNDINGTMMKTTSARWDTSVGSVLSSKEKVKELDANGIAVNEPAAFLKETTVAAQMPYLASIFPNIPVIPITISPKAGDIQAKELSRALVGVFSDETMIVMVGENEKGFFEESFSLFSRRFKCKIEATESEKMCHSKKEDLLEIAVVGDVMLARDVEGKLLRTDANVVFNAASKALSGADLIFGNLESVLSELSQDCSYSVCFKADQRHINSLLKMGFTHMSVANNHTYDYGEDVWQDSCNLLTTQKINPIGGYQNNTEPVLTVVKDKKIAFFAFEQVKNPQSIQEIVSQIQAAQEVSDYVIVSFSWGQENHHTAQQSEINLAHQVIDAGADIVIGHHPHVLQTIETYHKGLILYSMGNFVFDQKGFDQNETMVAHILFGDKKHQVELTPMRIEGDFPREATPDEQEVTLMRLASWSDKSLTEQILTGTVQW